MPVPLRSNKGYQRKQTIKIASFYLLLFLITLGIILNLSKDALTQDDVHSSPSLRLFKGALHIHTFYSDGHDTVAGRVKSAKEVGLDFIVITDHYWSEELKAECIENTIEGTFLTVMGWEVTMDIAHVPVSFIYEKPPDPKGDWSNLLEFVDAKGGFSWIAHPAVLVPFENWNDAKYKISKIHAIEIWNELLKECRPDPLIYPAGSVWDKLLLKGYKIWSLAAEDRHDKGGLGYAVVLVYAHNLTLSSIAESLRAGRFNSIRTPYRGIYQTFKFYIETDRGLTLPGSTVITERGEKIKVRIVYNIPWLDIDPKSVVETLQLISNGVIIYEVKPRKSSVDLTLHLTPTEPLIYYRVWIKDSSGGWAFSNPIFIDPSPEYTYMDYSFYMILIVIVVIAVVGVMTFLKFKKII